MGRVRSVPLCLPLLALATVVAAQEPPADKKAPRAPALGPAREVLVTPLQPDGLGVRVTVATTAADGSLVVALLTEDEQPPPHGRSHGRARGGEVVVVLRFAEPAAPGFYEVTLVHDPVAQPRWLRDRAPPGQRTIPVVLGTIDEAQAARDEATRASSRGVEALLSAASEVTQAFGPRARRWTRASLQEWLRDRAVPRTHGLEEALRGLRPTRMLAREEGELRTVGARALDVLAARSKQACLEHELALPSIFAEAEPTEASDLEGLLVEVLALRARARRGALAPEPSPLTLERLIRRLSWLVRLDKAAQDVARPDVMKYVLDDVRQGLARVRPALLALSAELPAAGELAARLAECDAAAAGVAPEQPSIVAQAALWTRTAEQVFAARDLVRRRELAEDRAELVALEERLADAGADPAAAAAWRRRLGVTERLVATAPTAARELAAWLREAGDLTAKKRALPPDAEARWTKALQALDALARP